MINLPTTRSFLLSILALIALLLVCGAASFFFKPSPPVSAESFDLKAAQGYWEERIRAVGGVAAYAELEDALEGMSPPQQHQLAHVFGGVLYDTLGLDGFSACGDVGLYGCYHEFIGHAIATLGIGTLDDLYAQCTNREGNAYRLHFNCLHSIGHGVVSFFGYADTDLNAALASCDTLSMQDPEQWCHTGLFMEYNNRFFLAPDLSDVRPPPEGNLYDPCDRLTDAHREICTSRLPEWWLLVNFRHATSTPFDASGRVLPEFFGTLAPPCRAMPASLRDLQNVCFAGIGMMAVESYGLDVPRLKAACAAASDTAGEELLCRSSAAFWTSPVRGGEFTSDALTLCDDLPEADRTFCREYALMNPPHTLPSL